MQFHSCSTVRANSVFDRLRIPGFLSRIAVLAIAGNVAATVYSTDPPRIVVGRLRVQMERVVNRPAPSVLGSFTVQMDTANDDSGRLFFADQMAGKVKVRLPNGTISTVLDLSGEFTTVAASGLLGLTFHPDFANPSAAGYRKLYTFHTVPTPQAPVPADFAVPGSTVAHHNLLTEWQVSASNLNVVDLSTRREVFREAHVDQTAQHNGGHLEFGPDGYLYGTIGTPASGGVALLSYAQNLSTIQGKIFRIDPLDPSTTPSSANPVSANGKYRIPADNPFTDNAQYPNALDEVFALGARHIYKFSLDSLTGKLFVGDVGEQTREEINVVEAGDNLGWPYMEGTKTGLVATPNPAPQMSAPIAEYTHLDGGRTVVGGYVYRGSDLPELQGKYVFGEFSWGFGNYFASKGRLLYMDPYDEMGDIKPASEITIQEALLAPASCAQSLDPAQGCSIDMTLFSLGVDDDEELYVMGHATAFVANRIVGAYYLPEGDYNEDGTVDAADYTLWRDTMGQSVLTKPSPSVPFEGYGTKADGDGDGVVDMDDYEIWKTHFGESISLGSAGIAAVPEPAAASLMLIAGWLGASIISRRRRV
jgi:glucose/arabinose dehydrogenase